jgi:hypothetical protein
VSKFNLRDFIRQHVVDTLSKEGGREDEIARIQRNKSLKDAFGFAGPGFDKNYNNKGETFRGPGGSIGFLGPGFKK